MNGWNGEPGGNPPGAMGYQGGYGTPGAPWGGMAPGWFGQPSPPTVTTGPVTDESEEDGFPVPRRLVPGSTVPVTRCPDGSWAISFSPDDGRLHFVVYVQIADGTFAPYHLEGVGSLRVSWDVTDGCPYLMCLPVRSGMSPHVLHLPAENRQAEP
jgi:hypothetical protein